jgi:hypothetical protein
MLKSAMPCPLRRPKCDTEIVKVSESNTTTERFINYPPKNNEHMKQKNKNKTHISIELVHSKEDFPSTSWQVFEGRS